MIFDLDRFKLAVRCRLCLPVEWDDPRTEMRHFFVGKTRQEALRFVHEAAARRKLISEAERYGEQMFEERE